MYNIEEMNYKKPQLVDKWNMLTSLSIYSNWKAKHWNYVANTYWYKNNSLDFILTNGSILRTLKKSSENVILYLGYVKIYLSTGKVI